MSPRARAWMLLATGLPGLVATLVACSENKREGPVPIVWDREACTECHMLVGEPKFAAQLQTLEGDVLNFDDPGCLLRFVANRRPHASATYFHHLKEDRWLPQSQAGFVTASPSPMGYGLGAVPRQTPGTLSFDEATRQVLHREAEHGP